jgi:hypothetical protein
MYAYYDNDLILVPMLLLLLLLMLLSSLLVLLYIGRSIVVGTKSSDRFGSGIHSKNSLDNIIVVIVYCCAIVHVLA